MGADRTGGGEMILALSMDAHEVLVGLIPSAGCFCESTGSRSGR